MATEEKVGQTKPFHYSGNNPGLCFYEIEEKLNELVEVINKLAPDKPKGRANPSTTASIESIPTPTFTINVVPPNDEARGSEATSDIETDIEDKTKVKQREMVDKYENKTDKQIKLKARFREIEIEGKTREELIAEIETYDNIKRNKGIQAKEKTV